MLDKYEVIVFDILEKEKAIRQADLIKKIAKRLNEDEKKVKNAINYRLSHKWAGKIFSHNYGKKIKILYLSGNKKIAEELCSNLTKRMRPNEIEKALSHFEEIKNKVLMPLRKSIPQIWWNGIFTFYGYNFDIKSIIGLSWKNLKLSLPKKLREEELTKYIAQNKIFVPFHKAILPIDKELLEDFIKNHLEERINPIDTFEKLRNLSVKFFEKKKILFDKIDKILREKLNFLVSRNNMVNEEYFIWKLLFYTILREHYIGKNERDENAYTDLDIIGNEILYIDVDDVIYYPIKSWYFLGEILNKKLKEIKRIYRIIGKLIEKRKIPEEIKEIFFELENILSEAEKIRDKLLKEIWHYFDLKHLIGICDKL